MKKLALSALTVGLVAGLAVPGLAETTTTPSASLTYARARGGGDARPYVVPPEVKAYRAQWLKVRADWKKHWEAMRPLKRQALILRLELRILLLKEKIDNKAVLAKVKQIADVKGKLMAERIFFRLAMKQKYPQLNRFRGRWGHGYRGRHWGGHGFRGGPGGPGRGWRRGPRFRGGPGPMSDAPGPRFSGPGPMAEGSGPMM
jgi:Spy/CpxP family protein refolding chaperone